MIPVDEVARSRSTFDGGSLDLAHGLIVLTLQACWSSASTVAVYDEIHIFPSKTW